MEENTSKRPALRPKELEAVYAISRVVAWTKDTDTALDEIIQLARPVFIFDNMVLYLQRGASALEPAFPRAIGRGRSHEAELAWGEAIANEVLRAKRVVERLEEANGEVKDRTRLRYMLGLPLHLETEPTGALVFIRFGGPVFEPDQIRLAEFIAEHVAQLLGHNRLVQQISNLEADRKLDRLQEDFISTISHELLTPLGFIKGYATTLLREDTTWEDETRREFLNIIDEEADRLRDLIENLMDSSRLQAGTLRMSFQVLRLDAFLKDVVLRSTSRDNSLKVKLLLETPEVKISVDPTRLAQVLDNLLTNASKYAPGSEVIIRLIQEAECALITVQDNGPGIAPEHLELLFKRFYRVPTKEAAVRGTGLGLFICRQIIRAHGGQIGVESALGKGTTFYIKLPLNQVQVERDILLRESTL